MRRPSLREKSETMSFLPLSLSFSRVSLKTSCSPRTTQQPLWPLSPLRILQPPGPARLLGSCCRPDPSFATSRFKFCSLSHRSRHLESATRRHTISNHTLRNLAAEELSLKTASSVGLSIPYTRPSLLPPLVVGSYLSCQLRTSLALPLPRHVHSRVVPRQMGHPCLDCSICRCQPGPQSHRCSYDNCKRVQGDCHYRLPSPCI